MYTEVIYISDQFLLQRIGNYNYLPFERKNETYCMTTNPKTNPKTIDTVNDAYMIIKIMQHVGDVWLYI